MNDRRSFHPPVVRHIGIDEAGLGPILGPFCAASIALDASRPGRLSLTAALARAFERRDPHLVIADSKAVFQGPHGKVRGEASALAAVDLESGGGGLFDFQRKELWRQGGFDPAAWKDRHPWYDEADDVLPLWCLPSARAMASEVLREGLSRSALSWGGARWRFLPEGPFNDGLDRFGNKSEVAWSIVSDLLRHSLEEDGPAHREVTVDRQGGRKFYAERLAELLPAWRIEEQSEARGSSTYRLSREDGRSAQVRFAVKADATSFTVAFASVLAKYLRETAMSALNEWFQRRAPSLRPTAGYPQDGRRWLADVKSRGGDREIRTCDLVRSR